MDSRTSSNKSLIWDDDDYDSSDTSSTEWVDMPTEESLTFVQYQMVRAIIPNNTCEYQQTSSFMSSTIHTSHMLSSLDTVECPPNLLNDFQQILTLPIAVAFPTGITIQQLTSKDDDTHHDCLRHHHQQQQQRQQESKTPVSAVLSSSSSSSSSCVETNSDTVSKGQYGWILACCRRILRNRRRRRIFCWSLALMILISCSVSTTLALFMSKHPTLPPDVDIPFTNNSTHLERFLWQTIRNYTDYRSFVNASTPQRKAWRLLLYELQHDKSEILTNHPSRIRQRFAMSTLFFLYAKDSDSPWFQSSLQSQHECSWKYSSRGVLNCTYSQNITHVNLNDQGLTGSLPMEIGMLSYLQYISLASNNMIGTIPYIVSAWRFLETMDFSMNALTGTLPEFISNFSNLRILRLGKNKFQGTLPSSWDAPQLPKLKILDLSFNSLSGSIQPTTWGRFTQLSILDLSYNNFSGKMPQGLMYAQNVQSLSISYNSFTGSQDVICSLNRAISLTADCLSFKMNIVFNTITPVFPCDCCTTCCSKTDGCFPQIGRVTTPNSTRMRM